MVNVLVPPINSKGIFKFKTPFDSIIPNDQELKVVSVRSISDLNTSNEKPYEIIYVPNNLTKDDFEQDVVNDVPIVYLKNEGTQIFKVPANRISTIPTIVGVKYQEKILAINLGALPIITNLDQAKDILKQDIYDTLGIDSQVEVINASAIKLVSKEDDDTYTRLRENKASIDKSYRTLYKETKELLDDREIVITKLQEYIKNNI